MFKGWALNGDEENLYDAGTEIGMDKADEDYTVKLKAVYEDPPPGVRYAVAIYGIKQDAVKESGKVAAMTFGPATDGNFTGNGSATEPYGVFYRACEGTSEASPNRASDGKPCIHWLTWSQIIAQANADPTVFEPCLENGCTHSVNLSLSSKLLTTDPLMTTSGDGTSIIQLSIDRDSGYLDFNPDSHYGYFNGWPASKMRTTLNGQENCTPDIDHLVTGSDLLSQADALISAFPSELQAAIVPKAVKSFRTDDTVKTTYDKLWLFSLAELFTDSDRPTSAYAPTIFTDEGIDSGGACYQRITELGITTLNFQKLANSVIESGRNGAWYSRSRGSGYSDVMCIGNYGNTCIAPSLDNDPGPNGFVGFAPGFCIGTANAPVPTAVLYKDGTMIFYDDKPDPADEALHAGITNSYTGWDTEKYDRFSNPVPWNSDAGKIHTVQFSGKVKPISTAYWFYDCNMTSFNGNGLDTSKVTSMASMFASCDYLTDIQGIDGWDVSGVRNMDLMFHTCGSITNLDLSSWNTNSLETMQCMFQLCEHLDSLNVTGWTTSNVTDMSSMFKTCTKLTALDLSTWYTGNVQYMGNMFNDCNALTDIQGIETWDVSNVTSMNNMFMNCYRLQELNLRNWDVRNVKDVASMFSNLNKYGSEPAKIYAGNWAVYSQINTDRNVFAGANVPGYDSTKVDGDMCKPQSMGGYFID